MEEPCAVEASGWTPLPRGDPLLYEVLQLLLHFVCSPDATPPPTSLAAAAAAPESAGAAAPVPAEEQLSSDQLAPRGSSVEVTQALNALFENAAAAAAAAGPAVPPGTASSNRQFDSQWVQKLWRAHFRQYLDPRCSSFASKSVAAAAAAAAAGADGFDSDLFTTQHLESLQGFAACLMQAAESVAKPLTAAKGAVASRPSAAASAASAAATSAMEAATATAGQQTRPSFETEDAHSKGILSPSHAVAAAAAYAQLCCLWLNQLMQQQLLLLMEHHQASGIEGRLQRIFRMLQRVLLFLSPLTAPIVDSNDNGHSISYNSNISYSSGSGKSQGGVATCSSALFCTCWRVPAQRLEQDPSEQQPQRLLLVQQATPASAVALCFARRFLRGFSYATWTAAAAAEGVRKQRTTALLRQFAAFTATEAPRNALLQSIRLQTQQQQVLLLQNDVSLLEGPLQLCVSTVLHSQAGSPPAAAAAAAGLSWGISSLGPQLWTLPCMQDLLFGCPVQQMPAQQQQQQVPVGLQHEERQQRGQYRIFWRLLEMLQQQQEIYASIPVASLFVQLLLDSRFWREELPEASGSPIEVPHCCRELLIGLLLELLAEQGQQQQRQAALQLLQCVQLAPSAATAGAAGAETLSKIFSRLRPLAKTALLRSLLVQQHEPAAKGSSGALKQEQQASEESTGGCCTLSSPEGQLQLLQLQLRCIDAVTEAEQELDDECKLLLLQLWLEQAPQGPLLQLLQQDEQQLKFVADEALRGWQHHRRSVQAAARSVWALLLQRCSEGVRVAAGSINSSSSSSNSCSSSNSSFDLLVTPYRRLFCLPTACRKALYQALAPLVHALGAARVLQLQPYLLQHLLSQLQNRSLRSAAMVALRALCEDLSKQDRQQQQQQRQLQQQQKQQQEGKGSTHPTRRGRTQQLCYVPSQTLRSFLMGPLQNALTGNSYTKCCSEIGLQKQQWQEEQQQQGPREYALLLPVQLPATADASPGEALDETMLPLLLRLEPSAAAPLLLCLREQRPLEAVEAAGATAAAVAEALTVEAGAATTAAAPPATDARLSGVALGDARSSFDGPGRPWSPSEAAVLAAARAAGLATWERTEGLQDDFSSCCSGKPNSSACSSRNSSSSCCYGCRSGGCGGSCCGAVTFVVRGCTSAAVPVCYRVSPGRLRQGLSSGQRRQRMRLLEALTLHAHSTAAPNCQELQLLLFAAGLQLRMGSAAERSQFVAAFERLLLRARNAFRVQLAAQTDATIQSLSRSGCCCCRPQQQHPDTCLVAFSPMQRENQQLKQQKQGAACGGAFGCFLLFLQRLHCRCLLSCYPGAPPDRVLICLALLRSLHSIWGLGALPQQHKKKSTVLQAAAAVNSISSSSASISTNGNQQQWAPEAGAEMGCAVGAALGWVAPAVRQQLLAMLPVVNGPAPRSLLLDLLQLLPNDSPAAATIPVPQHPQQLQQQKQQVQAQQQLQRAQRQEQQTHMQTQQRTETQEKQHQAQQPCQQPQQHTLLDPLEGIRRRVWGAVEMAVSIRQDYCAAGTLHLQLLLQQLFTGPAAATAAAAAAASACQHPAASAGSASLGGAHCELPAFVLQQQTIFCSALEEALLQLLPPALRVTAEAEAVAPLPLSTGSSGHGNGNLSSTSCCSCMWHSCGELLRVLCILTAAAEVRLTAVQRSPLALAEPQMGLHGILGLLEVCLVTIKPTLLQINCSNNSKTSRCRCKEATCAWRDWQQRVLLVLLSICRCLTSFVAAGDEDDTPQLPLLDTDAHAATAATATEARAAAASGQLEETANDQAPATAGFPSSSRSHPPHLHQPPRQQPEQKQQHQIQVDCRGHLVVCREDGEDTETQQQLLAFCSWRAVKGATECLTAFCKLVRFDQQPAAATAGESVTPPAIATTATPATAAARVGASRVAVGTGNRHDTEDLEDIQKQQAQQQMQQQSFLLLSAEEVAAVGSDLIEFLLACRHMGALEFLHDALAALCFKLSSFKGSPLQSLTRQWADEVLLLLLPSASEAEPDEQQKQRQRNARQQASERCAQQQEQQQQKPQEQRHPAAVFLGALGMPLRVRRSATGPPPPLRKSKTLSAQVHALNLLRSFVATSPELAACDVLPAAAAADDALRGCCSCNSRCNSADSGRSTSGYSSNSSSRTHKQQPTGTAGVPPEGPSDPSTFVAGEALATETLEPSVHPRSSRPMALAVAALAVSIQTVASADFPVRSAASSLQVAATKRLAGTDDETQRASSNPFEFCSGAALRTISGAGSGLLSIDFLSLASPQLRPLLAQALTPLVSTAINPTAHTSGNGRLQQNNPQRLHRIQKHQQQDRHELVDQANQREQQQHRLVIPQNAVLLVRGLAAQGPPGASEFISRLPVGLLPSTESARVQQQQQQQQEAAVAVLLLLTRTDHSSIAASDLPALETLLHNSPPNTILTQLREVAAVGAADGSISCNCCWCSSSSSRDARVMDGSGTAATAASLQLGARAPFGLGCEAAEDGKTSSWLLLLLRSLCCCLGSASFASRALAARALASYVLQRARTWGAASLVEALIAAAAGAAAGAAAATAATPEEAASLPDAVLSGAGVPRASSSTPASAFVRTAPADWMGRRLDANERSGLLLLVLEVLGRPDAANLVEEALGAEHGVQLSDKLRKLNWQLQKAAAATAVGEAICQRSAVERVLLLQVMRAVALVAPERYQEELWGRAAAASTAALGLLPDDKEIDAEESAAATATAKARGPSFISHVGLPVLQAVSLRLLVERHLRPRQPTAAADAAAAHLRSLGRVAVVIKGAVALSVHPQALESALLAVADLTRPLCTFRYEDLEFAQRLSEDSRFTKGFGSSLGHQAKADVLHAAEDVTGGLTTLWQLCWSILTNCLGIGSGSCEVISETTESKNSVWGLRCSSAPLSVSACEALAAFAAFAAAHPRLCRGSCILHPQKAAAAAAGVAAPAAAAASTSNAAAAAWTRLGAALLRCSAAAACSSSSGTCSSEMNTVSICFEATENRWAGLWASAVLRCAQPAQEVAVRLRAAEALSISGLPLPCMEGLGQGPGCCCSWAKLRAWRALLLLLQDEDVAVRDAAAAAASAAAAGLLCRLRSATARPTAACGLVGAAPVRESNEQMEETLLLLAAAATPILSDEPHGLEAGTLSQLLLQVLSRTFPERDVWRLLWRQLRGGTISPSSISNNNSASTGFEEETATTEEQQPQQAGTIEQEKLFEEEPMNIYGDPLLAMQVAARLLLLLFLQQQQQQQQTARPQKTLQTGNVQAAEADTKGGKETKNRAFTGRDQAKGTKTGATVAAVRQAVVLASASAIYHKGAAVTAVQDLRGRVAAIRCTCWHCDSNSSCNAQTAPANAIPTTAARASALSAQDAALAPAEAIAVPPTPTAAAALRKSHANARTLWLRKAMKRAAAGVQALHAKLSSTASAGATEAGVRGAATWGPGAAALWVLHPTQEHLYLQAQQVLLSAWVSLVLWLDCGLSFEDANIRRLAIATETLMRHFATAVALGQNPQPLVVAAAGALYDILSCWAAAAAADAATAEAEAAAERKREDVSESVCFAVWRSREEVKAFIEQGDSKRDTALAARSAQAAALLAECCLSLLPNSFPFSC